MVILVWFDAHLPKYILKRHLKANSYLRSKYNEAEVSKLIAHIIVFPFIIHYGAKQRWCSIWVSLSNVRGFFPRESSTKTLHSNVASWIISHLWGSLYTKCFTLSWRHYQVIQMVRSQSLFFYRHSFIFFLIV